MIERDAQVAQAKMLEEMALMYRRVASLHGPRDDVPTAEELAAESAPQIKLAEALEAGASALRVLASQEHEEDHGAELWKRLT